MNPRILHLTLHRKWFAQIAAGEKREEYRERKPYWIKRLEAREYDEVHFTNGYGPDRPFMRVEYLGCSDGLFNFNPAFVIQLGRILEIRNWPPKEETTMHWNNEKLEILHQFTLPIWGDKNAAPVPMGKSPALLELVDAGWLTWDGQLAALTSAGLQLYRRVHYICHTSVDDAGMSIVQEDDLDVLHACQAEESYHDRPRVSLTRKLASRIRRLERGAA